MLIYLEQGQYRMANSNKQSLKVALGIGAVFIALIAVIIFFLVKGTITPQMALLMFVGLFGLYFGVGVLIAVYRFVSKLD
jgi:uncharacterized membrane protein